MTDNKTRPAGDIRIVDGHKVSCDGGGGALGHPTVWYEMGDDDVVTCKYCDRKFVRKGSPLDPARG
jgi:uncharacterized Zn-finger protein